MAKPNLLWCVDERFPFAKLRLKRFFEAVRNQFSISLVVEPHGFDLIDRIEVDYLYRMPRVVRLREREEALLSILRKVRARTPPDLILLDHFNLPSGFLFNDCPNLIVQSPTSKFRYSEYDNRTSIEFSRPPMIVEQCIGPPLDCLGFFKDDRKASSNRPPVADFGLTVFRGGGLNDRNIIELARFFHPKPLFLIESSRYDQSDQFNIVSLQGITPCNLIVPTHSAVVCAEDSELLNELIIRDHRIYLYVDANNQAQVDHASALLQVVNVTIFTDFTDLNAVFGRSFLKRDRENSGHTLQPTSHFADYLLGHVHKCLAKPGL